MAKTPLYASWTWNLSLPEPFNTLPSRTSTDYYSKYCTGTTKKATLHGASLQAILAYMDMDEVIVGSVTSESALGTQGDFIISEYKSRTGHTHIMVFNKTDGKFKGCKIDGRGTPTNYSLRENSNTGSALFFTLMPVAMEEPEFNDRYHKLAECKKAGFPDMNEAFQLALILCDNLYRRIENTLGLGEEAIRLTFPSTSNLQLLTSLNMTSGVYRPTNVLYGTFQFLTAAAGTKTSATVKKADFSGKYPLSKRVFSAEESLLIPQLEDWYVVPPEVVSICKHAQMTSESHQPMRNFMLRGPAGTGKTEGAKAIAAGLGLPYMFYTCSANSEIYDFLGSMLPVTEEAKTFSHEYPTLEDIQMDPASAYHKLTGTYEENVSEYEVYEKLKEVMFSDAKNEAGKEQTGQRFQYVETPLIHAIRNGYVLELQEPTVIANPGVLVGLNALLDRCASVTLATGEVIHRHPDTVIVVTTNSNYAGCRDINQSILSRMNLIIDVDELDENVMAERVLGITGCKDKDKVKEMARAVKDINNHCKENMITDGSCGVRELISWVQSYMISNDVLESAQYTILSSSSSDPENRSDISSTCLAPKFAA